MSKLTMELEKEVQDLRKIVESCEKNLQEAPKGTLRIANRGGHPQYFHVLDELKNQRPQGKYIKRQDMDIVKLLAQKEYDSRLLRAAKKQLKVLEELQNRYKPETLLSAEKNTSEYRKKLIEMSVVNDETFSKRWIEKDYISKPIEEGEKIYITENGEKVRSKSEKMIADKLYLMGIPYRYESPVYIESLQKNFYPDFTLLNKRAREECYLEHFGMMDNPDYLNNFLKKIDVYAENGIILGKNLMVSFESSVKPINLRTLEMQILEFIK